MRSTSLEISSCSMFCYVIGNGSRPRLKTISAASANRRSLRRYAKPKAQRPRRHGRSSRKPSLPYWLNANSPARTGSPSRSAANKRHFKSAGPSGHRHLFSLDDHHQDEFVLFSEIVSAVRLQHGGFLSRSLLIFVSPIINARPLAGRAGTSTGRPLHSLRSRVACSPPVT